MCLSVGVRPVARGVFVLGIKIIAEAHTHQIRAHACRALLDDEQRHMNAIISGEQASV